MTFKNIDKVINTKQLPHDYELEKAILSTILTSPELMEEIFVNVELEYFDNPIYREVAEVVYNMFIVQTEISLLSVKTALEENKLLDKIGGLSWLADLTEYNLEVRHWQTYANKLQELYKKREIIKEARKMENKAFSSDNIDEDIISSFDSINRVLMEGESKSTDVEDNINLLENYIALNKNKNWDLLWWSWWDELSWLDKHTQGIRKGKTYRIGAPSGLGKTNLVYQTIVSLLEQWAKVLFVSLENNIETTYIKLLSTVQWCNPYQIEKGLVKPDTEWLRKYKNNFILTDQLFDINEIKRETLKTKPDVVILDYIWLVNIRGFDEKTVYNKYADEIKQFVQKHQWLAWIDLSNLNKSDDEQAIRFHKWFNGAAKLRNNTDVAIHMFDYQPFADYKRMVFESWGEESQERVRGKKAITFFLSKNRLGNDNEEETFTINFNEWIRYVQATEKQKELWQTLI